MAFTRKHYRAIAAGIFADYERYYTEFIKSMQNRFMGQEGRALSTQIYMTQCESLRDFTLGLAKVFGEANVRFEPTEFYVACGMALTEGKGNEPGVIWSFESVPPLEMMSERR